MAKSVTEIPLTVPKGLSKRQRAEIADLVIEYMVDRTLKGKDVDGKRFPKYSKAYTESLDFKNAGKSRSKVNLQLSGDMLAAIDLIENLDGKIIVGIDSASDEAGRAEGNILGSYGGEPDPSRARKFLGIDKTRLKKIIEMVVDGDADPGSEVALSVR
jgi:hypothetical protein